MSLLDCKMVYRGAVSGLSYSDYGKVINRLSVGTRLSLRPVTNLYDSRAVGVFLDKYQVGWIPKANNARVSELIRDKGATLTAVVTNHSLEQSFENRLYINVFHESDETPEAVTTTNQVTKASTKESKMTTMNKLIETNKSSAVSAAFLEAGHIANKQVSKLLGKQLPMMVRGYADTPIGRLVLANIAVLAVDHFRADNKQLRRLAQAMQVNAYHELLRDLDIDGMIDELLENGSIKRALTKLDDVVED